MQRILFLFSWIIWSGALLQAQSPQSLLDALQRHYYDDLPEARRYSDSALYRSDTANWKPADKARLYLLTGRLDYADGNYTEAIRRTTQAIALAYQLQDSSLIHDCYLHFGDIYIEKGYLDKAIEYQNKAVRYWERQSQPNALARSLHRLGVSYFYLRQWQQADTLIQRAINAAEQHEGKRDSLLMSELYIDKGKIHHFQDQSEQAAVWFDRGLKWAQQIGNRRATALGLRAFAAFYLRKQSYDSARRFYTQAAQAFLDINDQLQQARTLQGLGEVAMETGDLPNALQQLDKALLIARSIRAKILARDVYADLYRVYLQQENYQQALLHFRKFTSLKDSVLSQERAERIADIEAKYENEKLAREKLELTEKNLDQAYRLQLQQQELELQQFANSRKYWTILVLTAAMSLIFIIAMLIIRQNRLKARVRENELQEQVLQAQMNPHFIFNSLNSIQSLIATGDNAGASIYLARFAKLMRLLLQNTRRSFLSLKEEIEFLHLYVELEKRRFQQAFDYSIVCEEELDADAAWLQIPSFVVQPFVENAIAHGLLKKKGGGQLTIRFESVSANQLRCIVEDNGIGREAAAQLKKATAASHESLGIQITEHRLRRLLNISNKAESPLKITDLYDQNQKPCGTRIEILLPIEMANLLKNESMI